MTSSPAGTPEPSVIFLLPLWGLKLFLDGNPAVETAGYFRLRLRREKTRG